MNKRMQIYYNALFGAIGGFLGWLVVGSLPTQTWNIWLASAFIGAGVGMCIGLTVGAVEGVIIKRSVKQTLWGALRGAGIGLLSGMVGLIVGEIIFLTELREKWFQYPLMDRLGWKLSLIRQVRRSRDVSVSSDGSIGVEE